MESLSEKEKVEAGMEVDIFAVSAALVGVCLTVIQLIKMNGSQAVNGIADEILASDAILFLVACLSSYLALSLKGEKRRRRFFEKLANGSFLLALSSIVLVCALMARSFV